MNEVRVRVPASTANLGPGFDCLGVALQIYNTITVRRGRRGAPNEMISKASSEFFHTSNVKPFGFSWKAAGSVPRSRGLGSSVTVRLGILHGLNELAGRPLDKTSLFRLCAKLEGHPDNAAAAAFGGFTIAPAVGAVQCYRVDKSLAFVLLIPDFEISTPDARRALPKSIPLKDAALAAGNAAAIAGALASADYRKLVGCFEDRLHQPYREKLLPCLSRVISAGLAAGALGGWLSGSGSTIACMALGGAEKIAKAMWKASELEQGKTLIVHADNTGVRILK